MQIVRTVAELRAVLRDRRADGVGLVPTMGALHDGHLALARRAAAENGTTVMSIFVNPTQFNDPADLAAYPRDEAADAELAGAAGVDVLLRSGARRGLSARLHRHRRPARAARRDARGRASRSGPLPRRHHRGHQAAEHGLPRPGLLRTEGRPAGAGHPGAGPRPEHPHRDRYSCRRSGSPTAWPCPAGTRRLAPRERSQAAGLYAALSAARKIAGRGERARRAVLRAAGAVLADYAIEAEYLALVDSETFAPVQILTGRAGGAGHRGLRRRHPADRQRDHRDRRVAGRPPSGSDRGGIHHIRPVAAGRRWWNGSSAAEPGAPHRALLHRPAREHKPREGAADVHSPDRSERATNASRSPSPPCWTSSARAPRSSWSPPTTIPARSRPSGPASTWSWSGTPAR